MLCTPITCPILQHVPCVHRSVTKYNIPGAHRTLVRSRLNRCWDRHCHLWCLSPQAKPACWRAPRICGALAEHASEIVYGTVYSLSIAAFLLLMWNRRVAKATTATTGKGGKKWSPRGQQRRSMTHEDPSKNERGRPVPKTNTKATPLAAFLGSFQAGIIFIGLLHVNQSLDSFFGGLTLPINPVARNISEVIAAGVHCWGRLSSFILAGNALGLLVLGLKLLRFPEDETGEGAGEKVPLKGDTDKNRHPKEPSEDSDTEN